MNAPWVEAAWAQWHRRVADERVPHAVLVAGPAGLGKRALAADIGAALLCDARRPDGRACGRCRACLLLAAGTHPDFRRISFEVNEDTDKLRTEIVVEQIRKLRDAMAQTSQFGGWRVALFDPAEGMNTASFNALLKTLEEPAARAVLLLVADRPSLLPATIRSRCQRIDLRFPPRAEALAWLVAGGLAEPAATEALPPAIPAWHASTPSRPPAPGWRPRCATWSRWAAARPRRRPPPPAGSRTRTPPRPPRACCWPRKPCGSPPGPRAGRAGRRKPSHPWPA